MIQSVRRNFIVGATALFLVCLLIGTASFSQDLKWEPVQTYGMIPLDPQEAAAQGWSVNGLWAGFGMPEAIRSVTHLSSNPKEYPLHWSFPTTKAYVDACHAAGVLVPATLMGIAGHEPIRRRYPELENGACVGADGKQAYWDPGSGSYFMCANNPVYGEVLLTRGKEAIDAGADLIVLDEIQGNETCFYWSNQPGFCEHCVATFRKYLQDTYSAADLRQKFNIDDLKAFDFAKNLNEQRQKTWNETLPLFRELWRLQERQNYASRVKLFKGLRAYMAEKGRSIPICANTTGMGLGDYRGFRMPAIKWGPHIDFAAFEAGGPMLPRGKWVAAERLAAATWSQPSAVEILYDPLMKMQKDFIAGTNNRSVYLYGLLAESYANGCAFVNYHQRKGIPQCAGLWADCSRAQQFILRHKNLFLPGWTTGANVAVLYIENEGMRYRTLSYCGIVQALAESQIPYDILVDGGDGFVPVTLTKDRMAKYQVVFVPQALNLDPAQTEAMLGYVSDGGTLVTSDVELFGIEDKPGNVTRGKGQIVVLPRIGTKNEGECDLGKAYFMNYEDRTRAQIAEVAAKFSKPALEVPGVDRTVCISAHIYQNEKRVLVHAVNYDYDETANKMRAKENVTIRMKKPDFYGAAREVLVFSPDVTEDGQGQKIMPKIQGDFVEVILPRLDVYIIIELS